MSVSARAPDASRAAAPAAAGISKGLLFGGVICGLIMLMFAGSAAIAFAMLKNRNPDPLAQLHSTQPAPDASGSVNIPDGGLKLGPEVPHRKNEPVGYVEQPEEKPWLPKEEQDKVDKAIERGVEYLRKQQQPNGSWGPAINGKASGVAALAALSLLECGVKPDDPQVQKTAELVRTNVKGGDLTQTYDLALCILFLDRLGDDKDKPYIQTMALRLIAGQMPSGGWSYTCPVLSENDERELLQVLQDTQPARVADSGANRTGDKTSADRTTPKDRSDRNAAKESNDRTVPKDAKDPDQPPRGVNPPPGNLKGDRTPPNGTGQAPADQQGERAKPGGAPAPRANLDKLPQAIKNVPALKPPEAPSRPMANDNSDNSNTQFAILAIWVAGRYDVPTESVGLLIDRRFRTSQGTAGNWGYNYQANNSNPNGSPAMTCAGLLGLAVGHGVNDPTTADKPAPKESLSDDQIKKGFKWLSEHVGKSQPGDARPRGRNQQNVPLYFLWSVERVGVMYNLRTFGDKDGGKDWYGWGAELILDRQNNDGSWSMGGYHGTTPQIDTCFALLFLKRANLAKDLSTKIERLIDIKGVGNRN
jgi:hypothetical protein